MQQLIYRSQPPDEVGSDTTCVGSLLRCYKCSSVAVFWILSSAEPARTLFTHVYQHSPPQAGLKGVPQAEDGTGAA